MKRISRLISRYLVTTIVPYFAFSWLLLSVILFVQQAGRYSEIFFSINIPGNLLWQLAVALIPNVVAFTCPMAMLVGTIIGLSKMQGDSELVAIRAAGVGSWQIAVPIVCMGIVLSAFALMVNLRGVPLAASLVRDVALETAIKKLESPIEPGTFNSELAGFTIYVRDGDVETGRWNDIFIHHEDRANNSLRLITSREGRIDVSGEVSELVLDRAEVATLPLDAGSGKYVFESFSEIRFEIKTKRGDLLSKLTSAEVAPEEMGLSELAAYAATQEGSERIEAQILWQRRIMLSITPLIFCLLGTAIVLRLNRGGRGVGIVLALAVLVAFYLLALVSEQMARVGTIEVIWSGLIPVIGSVVIIGVLGYYRRFSPKWLSTDRLRSFLQKLKPKSRKSQSLNLFVDLTTGLRDLDLMLNLLRHFFVTLGFLTAIFLIFTAFDRWRFAGAIDGGFVLLLEYLLYLLPFIYLQIAPSAAMLAILATYVIKSRQNEIVTWTAAGQSVYRLLLPCFLLTLLLGGVNWLLQERVVPRTNRLQDEMRNLIRNRGVRPESTGRQWIAQDNRIYKFTCASDNEKQGGRCPFGRVTGLSVYDFGPEGINLQTVYRGSGGSFGNGLVDFDGEVNRTVIADGRLTTETTTGLTLATATDPLARIKANPNHINSTELRRQAKQAESGTDQRSASVGLEKKRSTLFLPLVVALFTAPFSLSLSRKGKAATVGYAVGLWLLFTGVSSVFEQFGLNGMLPPAIAIWFPLVIFSLFGVFLLSRVKS